MQPGQEDDFMEDRALSVAIMGVMYTVSGVPTAHACAHSRREPRQASASTVTAFPPSELKSISEVKGGLTPEVQWCHG